MGSTASVPAAAAVVVVPKQKPPFVQKDTVGSASFCEPSTVPVRSRSRELLRTRSHDSGDGFSSRSCLSPDKRKGDRRDSLKGSYDSMDDLQRRSSILLAGRVRFTSDTKDWDGVQESYREYLAFMKDCFRGDDSIVNHVRRPEKPLPLPDQLLDPQQDESCKDSLSAGVDEEKEPADGHVDNEHEHKDEHEHTQEGDTEHENDNSDDDEADHDDEGSDTELDPDAELARKKKLRKEKKRKKKEQRKQARRDRRNSRRNSRSDRRNEEKDDDREQSRSRSPATHSGAPLLKRRRSKDKEEADASDEECKEEVRVVPLTPTEAWEKMIHEESNSMKDSFKDSFKNSLRGSFVGSFKGAQKICQQRRERERARQGQLHGGSSKELDVSPSQSQVQAFRKHEPTSGGSGGGGDEVNKRRQQSIWRKKHIITLQHIHDLCRRFHLSLRRSPANPVPCPIMPQGGSSLCCRKSHTSALRKLESFCDEMFGRLRESLTRRVARRRICRYILVSHTRKMEALNEQHYTYVIRHNKVEKIPI